MLTGNTKLLSVTVIGLLLASTYLVFHSGLHRHAMHFISSLNTSHSSTWQSFEINIGDLTSEFEEAIAHVYAGDRFSVLEAMKRDGLTPVAVSEALVDRSYEESTIACSIASPSSTKRPRSALRNLSSPAVDSKTRTNDGSTNNRCSQVRRVPNVVHYVFLGSDLTFTFTNYLSYRSVERFIRPEQIFVHGDHSPSGKWWNRTIQEVKNIYHVRRTYSKNAPNGKPYPYPAHISDYVRTETLLSYGGIYLDGDVLIVKSFAPLLQFPFVIGRETDHGLCNGIMLAERGAPFLRLLLEQYRSYMGYQEKWNEKSVLNTDKLARLYPHLVHIEEASMNKPNWLETNQLYDERHKYNWTQNYAVHLWMRLWPKEKRPNGIEDILTKNSTFGELARLAVFGSHEIGNIAATTTSLQV